tara:strand:- start:326 stop:1042 length:717 start_codon:yes stop_codon:yes gene_type:complete
MSTQNLGSGEMEALTAARLGDLRKKVNAESWSDNMELLMKQWGEKAAGLRFMHADSGSKWKSFANNLAITGIIATGVASTLSLIATSVDDQDTKDGILFSVGGIGLISTLIQSFKKFYNAEEKAADHSSVAKQFGSFYRYMTLQLGMTREDRDPADILTSWALKEYERLQQEAPPISGDSIVLFNKKFDKNIQAIPDIAEDKFVIKVFNKDTEIELNKINVVSTKTTNEINIDLVNSD